MTLIKLGYSPKRRFKWKELDSGYSNELYNRKKIVEIHERLWKKLKNIMIIQEKGWDAPILIDGSRRSGKSTLAKVIAYLFNPNMTIDNYVSGMEETPYKIKSAKDGDPIIFDESSLVANSKDAMSKVSKQIEKIIDVCGVKRLVLIFCMPSFFRISQTIAIEHALFLIHVYTDNKMKRGFFAYFGKKKKKLLYMIGKKHNNSYSKPKSDFTGQFKDFHLDFEDKYMQLKEKSLDEALLGTQKPKMNEEKPELTKQQLALLAIEFEKNNPDVFKTDIAKGLGVSMRVVQRIKKQMKEQAK